MSGAPGTQIDPYEVVSMLGSGGMGEVYRARDTKLNREVAIKVLSETYRVDPDRLARLTHEAQVLASLNHQNIAAIHGFEQSNDVTALILELVEGPTLAERLEQGPIPFGEALPIARQIADALEAAHERGIIHRDLKPANVKLRADGTVKVLDFGLAKSLAPIGLASDLTQSPTMLSPAPTLAGVILGTAAYMAPEQARGKVVDKRTDIWAFGCVLYEMLTGNNPFARETMTDTVAAILHNEADWQALPRGTPTRIRSLIARCLKKDPAQRLRDIADGRFQIEEALIDFASPAAVLYAGSLDGKTKKFLVHASTSAVYAPPGYLLFVDGDTLLGQAFDAERLELRGQPFLVANHAARNTAAMSAVSASRTGAIAYAGTLSQIGRLGWIDRQGNPVGSPGTPEGDFTDFRLSPDETRLAASLVNPKTNAVELWLTDLARGRMSRVSSEGLVTSAPLWSRDGSRLIFRTNRSGLVELYERSAAGGGDDRPVLSIEAYQAARMSQNVVPTDWSPDGQRIIFSAASLSRTDLWLLPVGEPGMPAKFIVSPADEMHGNFSPDGHLIAYTSNESGRFEVYVETLPRSDRKWSVSTNGGYEPRWRADGREIYYLSDDRTLMAVSVGAGPSFGIPKPLFQTHAPGGVTANRTHSVPGRDGQRFLVNRAIESPPSPITVVVNWTRRAQ